jgi:hypothetical protein
MPNYKILFLTFLFAATTAVSFGANHYVRKGATGANNGSDWTNAWNEMDQINSSSVACGDTIWLGGGVTYSTGLTVVKTCTSGSPILIQSVLASDSVPTSAAGYTSSLSGQVVILNAGAGVDLEGSYLTLSGRGGTPSGNNFGISVQCNNTVGIPSGCFDTITSAYAENSSNITITYVEAYGPACVLTGNCGGSGAAGVNIAPSTYTVTNLLLDHLWIHQWGEAVRTSNWSNCTIQYTDINTTRNDGQQHEDVVYNYAQKNFTMRYNRIWDSPNDGIFFDFGGTNGFYFYGNAFYDSGGEYIVFKGGYTNAQNVYMYNNVFESNGNGDYSYGWLDFSGASAGSGAVENNVFENVISNGGESGAPPNANYNAYSVSSSNDGGSSSFNYSPGTQFVNEPDSGTPLAADFHLTSTGATEFAKGVSLTTPYNQDPDGNTRGAGGNWYIGAYQYLGVTPAPPTNLTGVAN